MAVAGVAIAATFLTPAAPASAGLLGPASCADIKASNPAATDGAYSILAGGLGGLIGGLGQLLPVYCTDMAGEPKAYLSLPNTGPGHNYSQYLAGGASRGTTVVTSYSAIRFDPVPVSYFPLTFRANIADQTFSRSTGQLCHSSGPPCPGNVVTSMPYGVAFDCISPGSSAGRANIDLTGTPFYVVDTFVVRSFRGSGKATFNSPQNVDLAGGGYCGWIAPADIYNPSNDSPKNDANGGWDLRLTLLGL
ncbi:MAG TPA: GON domain-containing protein [Mycobacteriales bacterium]|nr:GON domain-containing protein [Mycobacteriales bacterium]